MANYEASVLQVAQTKLEQQFQNNELRVRTPVTFLEFIRKREIMFPSHNEVRTAVNRTINVEYMARSSRSLSTAARAHNYTGVKGDSATLVPSWTVYKDGFYHSLKQANNNAFTHEEMVMNELKNVYNNFAEGLEDVATAYLFANRSTANAYARQGTFNATTDAFEITGTTNGDYAVHITKTVMDVAKYQGMPLVVFCDSVAYDKFERAANQGSGNSTNLSFQYSNMRFVKSIELDTDAASLSYSNGFWIAVPEGMIAGLDWIPVQNRQGVDNKEARYSNIINPIDGLPYAVFEYETRADESSNGGQTQDITTNVEISIDLSLQHAPQTASAFGTSPLFAFALV